MSADKIFFKYTRLANDAAFLALPDNVFKSVLDNLQAGALPLEPKITSCRMFYRKINDPISESKLKNMVLENPLSYVIEHTKFYQNPFAATQTLSHNFTINTGDFRRIKDIFIGFLPTINIGSIYKSGLFSFNNFTQYTTKIGGRRLR